MKCKGSKHEWVSERERKLNWNEMRFVFYAMNKKKCPAWMKKIKLRWDVEEKKKDAFKDWWHSFIVRIQLCSINGIEKYFWYGFGCNVL